MSGETESEILCWTRFWFRQRDCCSCESCWVKRILTKRPTGFNVFNRIKWQNWKPELVCGRFPTQIFLAFKVSFHIFIRVSIYYMTMAKKLSIIWRFSVFRAGYCHFISRQSNKFNAACMRDSIFGSPIFSRFADFSVIQRASIQVSEARKFLSLESVFFKFLFYVNAV